MHIFAEEQDEQDEQEENEKENEKKVGFTALHQKLLETRTILLFGEIDMETARASHRAATGTFVGIRRTDQADCQLARRTRGIWRHHLRHDTFRQGTGEDYWHRLGG